MSLLSVIREEFLYPSVTGDCDIHAVSWKPGGKKKPLGVIQIVHGMAEYIMRYDEMARYFAEKGFAVYGNDQIGHGLSVNEKYPLGYFGTENENGSVFVEDAKKLLDIGKTENPGVPYILFGHSMGSFVARVFIGKYGRELDGAVICGTAGKNPAVGVAIKLSERICRKKGKKPGKFLNSLAFSSYNRRTSKNTDFDWLSKDAQNVRRYIKDPLCGFLFSNQGFHDLFTLNRHIFEDGVINGAPVDLPLFFIAGTGDPVGSYGKGVRETAKLYKKSGHKDVKVKLYRGSRHEIHNDRDKVDVYKDILKFIRRTTGVGKGS